MKALRRVTRQLVLLVSRKGKADVRLGADYWPAPRGEVNYDEVFEDVTKRYPKIIARLAK